MVSWTMAGQCLVIFIDGLAAGEIDVGVLGGAAHGRPVRGQAALTVGNDQILVDHGWPCLHG